MHNKFTIHSHKVNSKLNSIFQQATNYKFQLQKLTFKSNELGKPWIHTIKYKLRCISKILTPTIWWEIKCLKKR